MATGVYATNMEIDLLKKELAQEANRLERLKRGENVSPPRVIYIFYTEIFSPKKSTKLKKKHNR